MSERLTITKSTFVAILTDLIDKTEIFTRNEWAEILGVSTPAISQWLNAITIPRADALRTLIEVLAGHDRAPRAVLDGFWRMARRPVLEVAPESAGRFGAETVGEYLLKPALKGFHRNFDPLPVEEKERVLTRASALCRKPDTAFVGDIAFPVTDHFRVFVEELSFRSLQAQEQILIEAARLCREDLPAMQVVDDDEADRSDSSWLDNVPYLHHTSGEELESLVRTAGMSVVRGGDERRPPSVCFRTSNPGSRYLGCFVWSFDDQPQTIGALMGDEFAIIPLQGALRLYFKGTSREMQIGARQSDGQLLRIKADTTAGAIPPFEVAGSQGTTIALLVCYRREGLAYTEDNFGRVSFHTAPWSEKETARYARLDGGKRALFPAHIPADAAAMDNLIEQEGQRIRHDPHDVARDSGQIADVDLLRQEDVLRFRLLRFPASASPRHIEDIDLARHAGEEIFIPLLGSLGAVAVSIDDQKWAEQNQFKLRQFEAHERLFKRAASTARSQMTLPDILFLQSKIAHGFYALGPDNAYALHIRGLDEKQIEEQNAKRGTSTPAPTAVKSRR